LLHRYQKFSLAREPSILECLAKAKPGLANTSGDKMLTPHHIHTTDGSSQEVLSECKLLPNFSSNHDLLKNQDIRDALNLDYQVSTATYSNREERESNLIPVVNVGEEKEDIDSYESDFEEGESFDLEALQLRSAINLTGDERESLRQDWNFATSLQTRHLKHAEDFQVKRDKMEDALETLKANVISKPRNVKRLASRRLFHPKSRDRGLQKLRGTEYCEICMQPWQHGDLVSKLGCGHVYHTDEISSWLKEATWCPSCRSLATDSRLQTKKSVFLL